MSENLLVKGENSDLNPLDPGKVCRICLKSGVNLRPANNNEAALFRTILYEDITFPISVCMYCGIQLTKFVRFADRCRTADNSLKLHCYERPVLETPLYNNLSYIKLFVTSYRPEQDSYIQADTLSEQDDIHAGCKNDIQLETKTECDDESGDDDELNDDGDDLPLSMLSRSDDFQPQVEVKAEQVQTDSDIQNGKQEDTRAVKKSTKVNSKGAKTIRNGFSSRMVQETEEYLVVKLTKDEVMEELKLRSKSESYTRAPYKCEMCVKGFNFEDVLNNHMEKHSPDHGTFVCDICTQYCPGKVSLRGHIKSHTTRYKCKICGEVRLSRQHLLEHFSIRHSQHSVAYNCEHCSFVTNKRTVIQRHVRSHVAAPTRTCYLCGQSFKNVETLRVHIKRHDASSQLHCPQCSKKFIYQSLLTKHIESVHVRKEYYCVECDIRFNSHDNLRIHFRKAKRHRDPTTFKHPCPQCAQRFPCNSTLSVHLSSAHNEVKQHACAECDRFYSSRDALRCHIRRNHSEQKPPSHACTVCDKVFSQKSLLRRHSRVHTGERPHACRECSLRFAQASTRDTHVALVHRKLARKKPKASANVVSTQESMIKN